MNFNFVLIAFIPKMFSRVSGRRLENSKTVQKTNCLQFHYYLKTATTTTFLNHHNGYKFQTIFHLSSIQRFFTAELQIGNNRNQRMKPGSSNMRANLEHLPPNHPRT